MSTFSRIASALAANAFGQVVNVVSQLLLPPLFFRFWGAPLYGEWLLLSSVPAYLVMADVGIGSAAGNEMVMRAGAGDRQGAQATFYGALWIAAGASLVVLLCGAAVACVSAFWAWPATPHIASSDSAYILLLLSAGVGMGFTGLILSSGFRSCGRNALGISLANTGRLLEILITVTLLLNHTRPLLICAACITARFFMFSIQALWLRRVAAWLFSPGGRADKQLVRRLLRPALGFMTYPLGNALVLQGPLLIIGATMGGAGVAMYSSLRTLARVPMQLSNMLCSSIWPELSRAHGAKDWMLLRRLHRLNWQANLALVLAAAIGQLALGHWVVRLWLGADAPYDAGVFGALIAMTALCVLWSASAVVLSATNTHTRFGIAYLLITALGIGAAIVLNNLAGWLGLLIPLILVDLALLCWVMPQVWEFTQDRPADFFKAVFSNPRSLLNRGR
jgi:O-antigen/teichoic acid export membrane protein